MSCFMRGEYMGQRMYTFFTPSHPVPNPQPTLPDLPMSGVSQILSWTAGGVLDVSRLLELPSPMQANKWPREYRQSLVGSSGKLIYMPAAVCM